MPLQSRERHIEKLEKAQDHAQAAAAEASVKVRMSMLSLLERVPPPPSFQELYLILMRLLKLLMPPMLPWMLGIIESLHTFLLPRTFLSIGV